VIRHVLPVRYSRSLTGVKECLGFNVAFVAYPAEYRSSGVMTFIVNADGVVYQKDLGTKTEAIGKAMKEYNRDSSWRKAEGAQDGTAGDKRMELLPRDITLLELGSEAVSIY